MTVCKLSKSQVAQCKNQYERFGLEHLETYCKRRGINFDEARQLVETGASNEAPVTTEIQQESKFDGLHEDVIDSNDNTIEFYYNGYQDEIHTMKRGFESEIIKRTFFDISSEDVFKNPNRIIVRRRETLLNAELRDLKTSYANYLIDIINPEIEIKLDKINETDTLLEKSQKLDSILTKAYQAIQSWKNKKDPEYLQVLHTFVRLKFFDDLLTNIPYVSVDPYQHPFSKKRYIYTPDKVDHYTGLYSNEEDYAADKSYSKLTHAMLKLIPETEWDAKSETLIIKENTEIGVDAFTSITQQFKEWLIKRRVEIRQKEDNPKETLNSYDNTILEELSKGEEADYGRLMNMWANDGKYISSLDRGKINTIAHFILGKRANGTFYAPLDVRANFIHTINSTVKTSWIETVQELVYHEDEKKSTSTLTSRTLTERRSLLEKANFTSSIIAHCIYWYKSKDEFNKLIEERPLDESFDNDKKRKEAKLKFLGKLLHLDLLSWDQVETENIIVNGKVDLEGIVNKLINFIIKTSDLEFDSDKDDYLVKKIRENIEEDQFIGSPILNFSKILASLNHSSYKSVIKNAEGNNMPIFQLRSLSKLLFETWLSREDHKYSNLVSGNIDKIDMVATKSSTESMNGKESFSKLSFKETISQAIVADFLYNLNNKQVSPNGKEEHRIFIQPHCYSDKKSSFTYGIRIDKEWVFYEFEDGKRKSKPTSFKPNDILNNIIKRDDAKSWEQVVELIRKSWNAELQKYWNNIEADYRQAFDPEKKLKKKELIQTVDNYIAKYGVDEFVKHCYRSGVKVIDGVHYVAKWKSTNKTINGLLKITHDSASFEEYFNRKLNQFVDKLDSTESGLSAWNIISQDTEVIETAKQWGKAWFEDTPSLYNVHNRAALQMPSVKLKMAGTINPIVKAFFVAQNLFGESINRFLFGNYYGHDNKKPLVEYDNLDKLEEAISNHVISQTKRLAVVGATYFPYDREAKYGVPKKMLMSVIKDEPAYVVNTNGESDDIDSKDGSGEASPYMSRMANASLHGAQVGHNKKTIWHFYNEKYGTAGMLKWAEYEVTNAKRRSSYAAPTSYERLYRKMHSLPLSIEQKNKIIENYRLWFGRKTLYYKDINTGNIVEIHGLNLFIDENGDLIARQIINSDGLLGSSRVINSIYDMDQILGGCWCQDTNSATGTFTYAETNQDILYKMICECDLKDKFIYYNSGASGMKTGRTCVNPKSSWNDDEPLMYFEASTEFGGVQMDADHDIAETESTEPTQLIIHIGQDGTMYDEVREIYEWLRMDIINSIEPYLEALDNGDKEAIKKIVSKSVIEAFQTGDKDVIGLAQTFVSKALAEEGYDIPLSSDSINSKFVSTVMSGMSKKTTKRHYAGVGAVLNPSYNTMVYYDIDGVKYRFEQVVDIIRNAKNSFIKENGFEPTIDGAALSIEDWINQPMFDGNIRNPFMTKPIYAENEYTGQMIESDPIEIGGEYILWKYNYDDNGVLQIHSYDKIKIENLDDLLEYKHKFINDPLIQITRNQLHATNLKGVDAIWYVSKGGIVYSVSQVENPYNLAMLHLNGKRALQPKSKPSNDPNDSRNLTSYLNDTAWEYIDEAKKTVGYVNDNDIPKVVDYLRNQQKQWLNTAHEGGSFFHYGVIEEMKMRHAEIMLGKIYAKELGLLPGDNVSDVKDASFFRSRIAGNYDTTENSDSESYDFLLFDGAGDNLYVVVGTPPQDHVVNDGFITIDGSVYRNNRKICSSDRKTFVKHTDGNGNPHNYVYVDTVEQLYELMNSSKYIYQYDNVHNGNYNLFISENKSLIPKKENKRDYEIYEESRRKEIDNLRSNKNKALKRFIDNEAQAKFDSFVKTMNFIGVRIPCQGMQSFAPLRVVGFVDVDTNEVYIPTSEQWIEGADYDKCLS